jgi:acetyl-CoA acetyltransferase
MRDVYIIGTGIHPWLGFSEQNFTNFGAVAVDNALKDAGIEWKQIQAIMAGIFIWGGNAGHLSGQNLASLFGETGVPVVNVYNACATGTAALQMAYNSVAAGETDTALAYGADVSPKGFFAAKTENVAQDRDVIRWKMTGMPNPVYWALECRKRMAKYGTTEEDLARVKVLMSEYASKNPDARFKKVYTLEEVLASAYVVDPLRLYMICPVSTGAAAAIVTADKKLISKADKPVKINAVTMGSAIYGDPTIRIGVVSCPAVPEAPLLSESYSASRQAYEKAGIGPEDIEYLELPDNSSWHYLVYLECCGFCKEGEADKMLRDGKTRIDGKLPTNMSGGFSSHGEAVAAQAIWQVIECANQLRGKSGERQVQKKMKVAMAQTYGLMGNSGTTIISI